MQITRKSEMKTVEGPSEYFTGKVTITGQFQRPDPSRVGGAIVHFEPGARTAWHTHPAGQTLIVTEGVGWTQLQEAAVLTRTILTELGLRSWLKTSGGKGLHVVLPIKPGPGWAEAKAFCEAFADAMTAQAPERYVATATKALNDSFSNDFNHARTLSLPMDHVPGSPMLVNIDVAAKVMASSKFRNAGQVCVSPTRFYVQEKAYDRFVARFLDKVKTLKVGPGTEPL